MKKILFIAFISLMAMPMTMFGQSYKKMWKEVAELQAKDLPQQVIKKADQIAQKARKDEEWGHLLKARLLVVSTQVEVAPDSLQPSVARLDDELKATRDGALKAVLATVLWRIYDDNGYHLDSVVQRMEHYRLLALAQPDLLARTKASTFDPLVDEGRDSRYFGNDLLSLIAVELKDYKAMHRQYVADGNRTGACLAILWQMHDSRYYTDNWRESEYVHQMDSLIQEYGDLDVAAELGIERCDYICRRTGATKDEQLDCIRETVARWPKWPRMNQLRNMEQELINPTFDISMEQQLMASTESQELSVTDLRNVRELTLNLYRTDLTGDEQFELDDDDDYSHLKPRLTLVSELTQTRRYDGKSPTEYFRDTLTVGPLPLGIYLLELTATPATTGLQPGELKPLRRLFYVSDLYVINQEQPTGKIRYVVVNRTTGQPVSGARLKVKTRYNAPWQEFRCDEKGEFLYDGSQGKPSRVYAATPQDLGYDPTWQNNNFNYYGTKRPELTLNFYTDRSIYRPGQTVHAAVIAHTTSNFIETQAAADKRLTLRLRNANYKVIDEKEVLTDAYGKASADFVLPTGELNGRFCIEGDGTRHYFRVEDYKRPTFEVNFDEVTTAYKAGDTLAVKGLARTYSGVGVQGATVRYTVKRRVAFWWLSYSYYWSYGSHGYGYDDTEITSGELTTGPDGRFTVDVPLELPYGSEQSTMFYQFVVETDVTDQAGETRSGSTAIPVGTRDKVLTCDLSDKVLIDEQKAMTFRVYNAAGKDIPAQTVRFRIDGGQWQTVEANTQQPAPITQLKSGQHLLEAECDGCEPLKHKFTVFSLDDQKPCTETDDWFYQSATGFPQDGSPVTVQVGSSRQDVHMVYNIISGSKLVESGAIDLSDALWNRKLTYKPEYENGLLLTFAWVKDGQLYSHQATIKRPLPEKKLTLRWETFRDRLTPGQKEEWSLTVLNPDGTPADAQLMAAMYDKSLDQLYSHQWAFQPYMYLPLPSTAWSGSSWSRLYGNGEYAWEQLGVPGLDFSSFNFSGLYALFRGVMSDDMVRVEKMARGGARNLRREMVLDDEPMMAAMPMAEAADETDAAPEEEEEAQPAEEEPQGAAIQMRENLNETAFFFPALVTDQKGRVAIRFTLPESLTTWRFMGIATTEDMKSGYLEGEAVAQKEVMVQPNMPRFIRQGDRSQISVRIFNTTDHAVSGTAMLRLLDAETQKQALKLTKPFTVKAGETAVVVFEVEPQSTEPLYICQVSASGKTFNDGEQHYLAVLPNQERVTLTAPFTQHQPGTHSIDLTKLFPTGTGSQKLTVEYTNNPAWLMVQALPSVGNPAELDAIDQAAWLYSNLIAKTLIGQSANIKHVFERWKRESADDGSLVSQLEKNQELKDLLLQETPWVLDADRETEQKQRLADFFDENQMQQRITDATQKLSALQLSNGSWSWWPGMSGSFYMTVTISEMLTRLNVMAGRQHETAAMLDKAFSFMGNEIIMEVKLMKEWEKKNGKDYGFPSFKALQYLYICALDGRQLPKEVQQANDYLIKKMKKDIKSQTIYEKALSAIILQKHGEARRAAEYAQSLKEFTVFTEEKGRYYDTPRAGYSWYDYKIPTEVMAIEALKVITPQDGQTVEEMQRWLLQEKRTQAWDTPINSVNAVYAFLFDNTRLLDAQEPTVLAIDGKPLDLPRETAGIGYVKTSISQPQGREFTAKKTSTGTSWGALYAQFMQPVSDIENAASGLSVKREVVVLNNQSTPITPTTPITLKVGDRIRVRITINSERDLDFVQVVDRRAACMEPVEQLSGYRRGAYCSPRDFSTNYYFDMMPKGKHVIETEYFIDRAGTYQTGTCVVQCAYSPEYRATAPSMVIKVKE